MMKTEESPAYPHAEVLDTIAFDNGQGWYGKIHTPEVGPISVFSHTAQAGLGPACTIYRFTRDGLEYSATERRYRSLPRGASIVARNWARECLQGLDR